MAIRYQVDSIIKKKGPRHPYHQISHICGLNPNQSRWQLSEGIAIEVMEDNLYKFYVLVNKREVEVIIGIRNGKKYLKTMADTEEPESLLRLPECV